MTDKELQKIKERCDKATPGKWHLDIRNGCVAVHTGEGVNCIEDLTDERIVYYADGYRNEKGEWNNNTNKLNNAEFIAHSKADILTLIAEVKALQSENTRLKAETETNRVRILQYENLRQCFEQLTNLILGKRYYNEACDVYRADEYTCRDMWNKAKPIFSNKKWRGV